MVLKDIWIKQNTCILGLKWNAFGISEHDVEKTWPKKWSQNGSNLAKFACWNRANFSLISCSVICY